MHTKKINNTNKLIQVNYHSVLTKIQKLPKKKRKEEEAFFSVSANTLGTGRYCPKSAGMANTWPIQQVFKPIWNVSISIPVYVPVWYILAGMGMVSTTLLSMGHTTLRSRVSSNVRSGEET